MTIIDPRQALVQLPLKEMDAALLALAIMAHVETSPSKETLRRAIELASLVHRKATRDERGIMPRDHYITHPLRNTLRLMRWGVTDPVVLVASILHDTVEDAAPEMLTLVGSPVPSDYAERVALVLDAVITPTFGRDVARVLAGVTNPEFPKGLPKVEKHRLYREHAIAEFSRDEQVLLVKLSDLIDNAGSLHHNLESAPAMVLSLAIKYLPLMGPLYAQVEKCQLLTASARDAALEQVSRIEQRLLALTA